MKLYQPVYDPNYGILNPAGYGMIETKKNYRVVVYGIGKQKSSTGDFDTLEECADFLASCGIGGQLDYLKRVGGGDTNLYRIEKTRYATDYQMF